MAYLIDIPSHPIKKTINEGGETEQTATKACDIHVFRKIMEKKVINEHLCYWKYSTMINSRRT
jgi:hypothetical protein